MSDVFVPSSCLSPPHVEEIKRRFIGQSLDTLPTPSVLIDLSKMKSNISRMQKTVSDWHCLFRAHIKTHKTREGTAYQLSQGNDRSVIVSTLAEAWGVCDSGLIDDGTVDDILYGVPPSIHKVPEILSLRRVIRSRSIKADLKLLVDSIQQVEAVQKEWEEDGESEPIFIFIKIDAGYHRAGVTVHSSELVNLVRKIKSCDRVAVWGVYCHAGNSYGSTSSSKAVAFFTEELQCTNEAAQLVDMLLQEGKDGKSAQRHRLPLVLSVGSTPTAHAASDAGPNDHVLRRLKKDLHGDLELHAGNYAFLDLQQVATGAIPTVDGEAAIDRCSLTVLTSVVSVYPGRGAKERGGEEKEEEDRRRDPHVAIHGDEALCDAGGVALSKDTGPLPGFGYVVSPPHFTGWQIGRVAQEHGVLTIRTDTSSSKEEHHDSVKMLSVGDKLQVVPQHACMVASAHPWLFIHDSTSIITDVWIPWKGW
ncbi:hypothetical protein CBS101457_004843 [Exobasidium rhododendri]|nr:hypothetical protein CBS101457_004843 [Exobasidium rhododendri]